MGGSHKLGALGSLFSAFPEITNMGTCMKTRGEACRPDTPCAAHSFPTALRTNHKLLPVKCWELSARQSANPELQGYPKWMLRNACRVVLPLTDWNKTQDSTLFLLFPRTLQLHTFPARVKVNSISCTEMKNKALHCLSLWTCQAPFHTCPSAFQTEIIYDGLVWSKYYILCWTVWCLFK